MKKMNLADITDRLKALMPAGRAPALPIEVRQLGLATGQAVTVRVIKRVHIPVKYIES